jgi:hypothetical protein
MDFHPTFSKENDQNRPQQEPHALKSPRHSLFEGHAINHLAAEASLYCY